MDIPLDENQMASVRGGEPVTLSSVLAVMAIAVMTVVVYKLFRSGEERAAKVSLPGGFSFAW